ncbi:MAG: thioredoxin domain-containing protein [Crenarchaeota archaeon]|nr:thioredoxin domain-containing protein [Thermoproteota archaeon]
MALKRVAFAVIAAVLIGIVVASVILIVARGRLWNWYYTATPAPIHTAQSSTPVTTTTRMVYVSLSGPRGSMKSLLDSVCGKSSNLLVILYLKTKPNATFVKMVQRVFDNVLSRYAKLSAPVGVCLVNVSKEPSLLREVETYSYPVVALALRGSVSKELYNLFNNVSGLLIAKETLTSYLLGRLTQYLPYESIPVETRVEPRIDNATPVLGSRSAPVYLFIYEDSHCPYCAMFYHETMPSLLKLVKEGKLAIVFKNLIVHPQSLEQHVYIEAMYLATRNASAVLYVMEHIYSRLYDTCFVKNQCYENTVDKEISDAYVFSLIERASGLKISQLQKYVNESKEIIQYDTNEALRYGISGTPGFIIWNREKQYGLIVVGVHSPESMISLINKVLSN